MTVLDLSSNDISTLDPECFKREGVTGVIIGVYSPTDAPNQMRQVAQRCRDAGLTIHGFYGLIYFGSYWGEVRDTGWAIQLAKEFDVKRIWLDCEADGDANGFAVHPVTPEGREAAIQFAVDMVQRAGLTAGIYTGGWWWPGGTGNSTAFAHLPLWNSYYDQDPDIDGLPYGGWATAAVEQYSSTIEICGRRRDHNRIYEEDDDMTPEEAKAIAAGVFDDNFSTYFLRAMRQYFTVTADSDFSDAPDSEVAAAIAALSADQDATAAVKKALAKARVVVDD